MRETCQHDRPVFGCSGCVNGDKARVLAAVARETAPPECPECGRGTVMDSEDPTAMTLSFACTAGFDRWCDGEVDVRVRR